MLIINLSDIRLELEEELCAKCYREYLKIIEPRIKSLIENYFRDWQYIESIVTLLAMNAAGIFKHKMGYRDVEKESAEDFGDDLLDPIIYEKIKSMSFKQKIDYLHMKGVIGDSLYKVLNRFRRTRNRIHQYSGVISEEDRTNFARIHAIVAPLLEAQSGRLDKATEDWLIHSTEESAMVMLLFMDKEAKIDRKYPEITKEMSTKGSED